MPPDARRLSLGLCLSGGADSCALALSAARIQGAIGTEIVALHARHALRGGESEGDALAVRELCASVGLPLVEVDAAVPHGPNLEARARAARYAALRGAFPGLLATAHHRSDQAETVALRLLRGAGPGGLRGIHALRSDRVWRPFLDLPRARLEAVCRDAGWRWREDSSNRDPRHLRNWIRLHWLPNGPRGLEDGLAALAAAAERLSPHLERRLAALEASLDLRADATGFRLDLRIWDSDADHPELDLLLERAWTRCGRRPWAAQQRRRLLEDALSGARGRRSGGQGETAIWGGRALQVRVSTGAETARRVGSSVDG